jgi:hypothetical protein
VRVRRLVGVVSVCVQVAGCEQGLFPWLLQEKNLVDNNCYPLEKVDMARLQGLNRVTRAWLLMQRFKAEVVIT